MKQKAWTYYKKAKQEFADEEFLKAIDSLYELQSFGVFGDAYLNKGVIWLLIKILFKLGKEQSNSVNDILLIARSFEFERPSEEYSILMKAALRHKDYSDFLSFAKWWRLKNLREADFENEWLEASSPQGKRKKLLALAERAYMGISNALLTQKSTDIELVKAFVGQLHSVILKYPKFTWLPYFEARLILLSGESRKEILQRILPFVRSKQREFWAWDLMARLYKHEAKLQLACYSAALLCVAKDDFLVKVREDFAVLLLGQNFLAEAKTEAAKLIETKEKNGHKIPKLIERMRQQTWWNSTEKRKSNLSFYKENSALAYGLLYAEEDFKVAVVQYVNVNKLSVSFVVNKKLSGFFFYKNVKSLRVGDVLEVSLKHQGRGSLYKLIKLRKTTKTACAEIYKKTEGNILVNKKTGSAMLNKLFIPKFLVSQHNLSDGQFVKIKAVTSFHAEKKRWNWKIFQLTINN